MRVKSKIEMHKRMTAVGSSVKYTRGSSLEALQGKAAKRRKGMSVGTAVTQGSDYHLTQSAYKSGKGSLSESSLQGKMGDSQVSEGSGEGKGGNNGIWVKNGLTTRTDEERGREIAGVKKMVEDNHYILRSLKLQQETIIGSLNFLNTRMDELLLKKGKKKEKKKDKPTEDVDERSQTDIIPP